MADLRGKVAVITGAAGGLGAACAHDLLSQGCDALLADIKGDEVAARSRSLQGDYPQRRLRSMKLDARRQADCFALADYALEELGALDIMVNSAGITSPCPSLEVTQEDWENLLRVNLHGVFFCCQAAARAMRGRGGVIVNISSIASKAAWPQRASYAAAKAGLGALTETLAVEWAALGIRVNAVAPVWVNTEMLRDGVERGVVELGNLNRAIPLGRVAEASEISKVVVFLASEAARFITGQTIYVDGGYLAGAPDNAIGAKWRTSGGAKDL